MKADLSVIFPFGLMLLTSCADLPIIATQNDVIKVQTSVNKLEEEIGDIKRNQAQYGATMDELNSNVLSVTGNVEELINSLAKRIENLEKKLTGKVSQLPQQSTEQAAKPPAGSSAKNLYDLAYKDLIKGNYALAIMGFDELIKSNPQDELAQDARYWKAECYFSQKKWEKAIEEFNLFAAGSPASPDVKKAKYKIALAYLEAGNLTEAEAALDAVISAFPLSDEAAQAKEKKKALTAR